MIRLAAPIVLVLVLLVGAPLEAMAYRIWLETAYTGHDLQAGEPLQVEVHLDTEGDTGVSLFSVSVLFPHDVVTYDAASSDYGYYPLYVPAGAKGQPEFWFPSGPNAPDSPAEWPVVDGQVNIDLYLNALGQVGSTSTSSDELLAILVFRGTGIGSGQIELSADSPGNVFMMAGSPPTDGKASVAVGPAVAVNAVAVPVLGGFGAVVLVGLFATTGRRKILAMRVGGVVVAVLFLGLALGFVGAVEAVSDTDGDGVDDPLDNCVLVANGPLSSNGTCSSQQDTDQDGYGDVCDTDFNNDGATGLDDWLAILSAYGGSDPAFDLNCDGISGAVDDTVKVIANASVYALPGPSGLACAGTVPCP